MIRITETITRYLVHYFDDKHLDKVIGLIQLSLLIEIFTAIITCTILYLLSSTIVFYLFTSLEYLDSFQIFSFYPILLIGYATSTVFLRVTNRFKYIFLLDLISTLAIFFGVLYVVNINSDWINILYAYLIGSFFKLLVSWIFLIYTMNKNNIFLFSRFEIVKIQNQIGEIFKMIFSLSITYILKNLHIHGDTVLIGLLTNPTISGAYKLAKNIIQLLAFPTNALFQVTFPEFSKLLKNKKYLECDIIVKKLIGLTIGLVCIYVVLIWFFAPMILPHILGDTYTESINQLHILVIGLSIILVSQYWYSTLISIKEIKYINYSMLSSSIFQFLIIILFIETYGIVSASIYVRYYLI